MPAVLVDDGRAAVASAIKSQKIYLAWGSGQVAWDTQSTRPAESTTAKALFKETGRRIVSDVRFVVPDSSSLGTINVSTGRFRATADTDPQKYLYLRFTYEFGDGVGDDLRELGVFVGGDTIAEAQSSYHNGYFIPSEVTNSGLLLVSQYIDKVTRTNSMRQQFEFVIQF